MRFQMRLALGATLTALSLGLPSVAAAAVTITSPTTIQLVDAAGGGTAFVVTGTKAAADSTIEVRLRSLESPTLPILVTSATFIGGTTFSISVDAQNIADARPCANQTCTPTPTAVTPAFGGAYTLEVAVAGAAGVAGPKVLLPTFAGDRADSNLANTRVGLSNARVSIAPHGTESNALGSIPGGLAGLGLYDPLPTAPGGSNTWDYAWFLEQLHDATGAKLVQATGTNQGFVQRHFIDPDGTVRLSQTFQLSAETTPTSVRLTRLTTISPDGTTVGQSDSFVNTGTTPFSLSALYLQNTAWAMQTQWQFPWIGSTYAPGSATPGTPIAAAPAGSAMFAQHSTADPAYGHAWVTFDRKPDALAFNSMARVFATYNVAIPANSFVTLKFGAGSSATAAIASTAAAASIANFAAPTVTIKAPSDKSTVTTSTVTVSGTASDNKGVTQLTLNGTVVPLSTAGTWTTNLPLTVGANTITAIATDADGNTARATATVTFLIPVPPTPPVAKVCVVPRLTGKSLAGARIALRKANCAVGRVLVLKSKKKKGNVIGQGVPAGWQQKVGTKVNIAVSRGGAKKKRK